MAKFQSINLTAALPVVLSVVIAGCSMPTASDFKPSKLFSLNDDEPEKGTPTRIVSTWKDTVLTQAGKPAQRGFGGRLFFYNREDGKPILVDGQLVVYAFDESNREVTDNKPTRRYVFPPEQVPLHMSKSELGASYSFWLPWDEVGGPQTEVSLICRFESKQGGVITSEQTKHRLPGEIPTAAATAQRPLPPKLPEGVPSRPAQPTLESVQENRNREQYAQLASYESSVAGNAHSAPHATADPSMMVGGNQQMVTTSIALPENYRLPMGLPNIAPATAVPQRPQTQTQAAPQSLHSPAPMHHMPMQPQAFPQVPGAMPIQQPATPAPQLGHLQAMPSMSPTVAMPSVASPTVHVPTGGVFGNGAAATTPQQTMPPATVSPLAALANARAVAWSKVQTQTMPLGAANGQQPVGYLPQQPQTMVQPASQPLPAPTGLTTTVSYPPAAAALR